MNTAFLFLFRWRVVASSDYKLFLCRSDFHGLMSFGLQWYTEYGVYVGSRNYHVIAYSYIERVETKALSCFNLYGIWRAMHIRILFGYCTRALQTFHSRKIFISARVFCMNKSFNFIYVYFCVHAYLDRIHFGWFAQIYATPSNRYIYQRKRERDSDSERGWRVVVVGEQGLCSATMYRGQYYCCCCCRLNQWSSRKLAIFKRFVTHLVIWIIPTDSIQCIFVVSVCAGESYWRHILTLSLCLSSHCSHCFLYRQSKEGIEW